MSGTVIGGKRTAATNRARHGRDFYRLIGAKGGRKSTGGGFADPYRGKDGLTGRERASVVGRKGGAISRRGPKR